MTTIAHLTMEELDAGLEHIRRAPKDQGVLELLVRRPVTREREVLPKGQLDLAEGLVGDNWSTRGSSMTDHDEGHPEMQLNIMNARSIAHIAQDRECWPLAGDQLYIDMDISEDYDAENFEVVSLETLKEGDFPVESSSFDDDRLL